MLLKTILTTLCAFSLATAAPQLLLLNAHQHFSNQLAPPRKPSTAREVSEGRGVIGGMTMCTGTDFTGDCSYIHPPMETCYAIPSPFQANIASFKPDQGLGGAMPVLYFGCRLYSDDACSEGNVRFEYPGVSNGKLWVDPKSVKCEFYDPKGMEAYKRLKIFS